MQQILWVQFDREMLGVVGGAGLAAADLKAIETCGVCCFQLFTNFEHHLICIRMHLFAIVGSDEAEHIAV